MAVGGDVQVGVTLVEDAPQRTALPGGPPPGLVHVHRPAASQPLEQVVAGLLERVGDAGEDRIDRAGTDPRPIQLLAQLDDITTRDAVAHRQRRDGRLQPRTKRAGRDLAGKLCPTPAATTRAAHTLTAMLGHRDRDHRQLLDLMAQRIADRHVLVLSELVTAVAAIRPVIDDRIDRPRRQQRAALALMPGLATLTATRRILPAPRHHARRINTRRLRTVTRASIQPPLELRDPLVLTSNSSREALDLRLKALVLSRKRQQHRDDRITPLLVDGLRLGALHTAYFDAPELCPPTH
jgi:hypothetical protein